MKAWFICRNLQKSYGGRSVLPGIDLTLQPGSITAFIGASGCGKSTLLRVVAGLESPDAGEMLLEGVPCGGPGMDRVMVFQDDALFPWLSVAENVIFGLENAGMPPALRQQRARELLALVGLEQWEQSLPSMLSGGMRQRVALARALVLRPKLLLLDEPFAALDAITRSRMQALLASLQARTGVTVLMVTHDVAEACLLADTVHLMGTGAGIVESWAVEAPRPRDVDDPALVPFRARLRATLEAVM